MASSPRRSSSRLKVAQAWRRFHETPDGRAALAELAAYASVYSPIETTDPIEAQRMEGERRLALRIIGMLSLRPGDLVQTVVDDTDLLSRMMARGYDG